MSDYTEELALLRNFYKAVARLTSNHDVIEVSEEEDYAVVFPSDLGEELEKVDKQWWKHV